MSDGLKVIDVLAAHPSTAKFIARKLAVKFVSDKPSEALVNRIAAGEVVEVGPDVEFIKVGDLCSVPLPPPSIAPSLVNGVTT